MTTKRFLKGVRDHSAAWGPPLLLAVPLLVALAPFAPPVPALGDMICYRSAWADMLLLASAGIETIIAHALGERASQARVALVAARAAHMVRLARVFTGVGVFTIFAEAALMYYDNSYC